MICTTYDLHTLRMIHFNKDYIVCFEDEHGKIRDYAVCKRENTWKSRDMVFARAGKKRWRGDVVMYPVKAV